jgi:serine/threonine-protein kinase RsbW
VLNLYTLQIAAELKNLETIRRFVAEAGIGMGVSAEIIPKLQLAVDEVAANAMLHGYQGQAGSLTLEVEPAGANLVIRLRDDAPPFDPTQFPAPDITLPLSQRTPGGLGIYLVHQVMDEVIHRLTPSGGNELTLVKRNVIRFR